MIRYAPLLRGLWSLLIAAMAGAFIAQGDMLWGLSGLVLAALLVVKESAA